MTSIEFQPDLADDRVAPAAFRDLMSTFPTGVAVVTATGSDGDPHGLTCTSLCPVTLDPATMLVCLNRGSGTLGAVRESGSFAVNLLHTDGRHAAEVFSSAVEDRFRKVTWWPSPRVGQPWLTDDAFAVAECRVTDTRTVGDHEMVLGELAGVEIDEPEPLLYGMRRFAGFLPGAA